MSSQQAVGPDVFNPFQPESEGEGLSVAGSQIGLAVLLRLSAVLGRSMPRPQLHSTSAPANSAHVQLHFISKVPRTMGIQEHSTSCSLELAGTRGMLKGFVCAR